MSCLGIPGATEQNFTLRLQSNHIKIAAKIASAKETQEEVTCRPVFIERKRGWVQIKPLIEKLLTVPCRWAVRHAYRLSAALLRGNIRRLPLGL